MGKLLPAVAALCSSLQISAYLFWWTKSSPAATLANSSVGWKPDSTELIPHRWRMKKKPTGDKRPAQKPPAYPEQTAGSALAAEVREEANSLTESQRKELFLRGMQLIYGGASENENIRSR